MVSRIVLPGARIELPRAFVAAALVLLLAMPTAASATPQPMASGGASSSVTLDLADDWNDSSAPQRVIVELAIDVVPAAVLAQSERAAQAQRIRATADRVIESIGADDSIVRGWMDNLPFVALEVTAQELAALAVHPDVVSVAADEVVSTSLDTSVPLVGASNLATAEGPLTGQGRSIAVLDTGVQASHPFFAAPGSGRVIAEACFTSVGSTAGGDCPNGTSSQVGPGAAAPIAGNGHGTHVAGIAAGSRESGTPTRGVAPGADIVAVQVFTETDSGLNAFTSDVIRGLDWVVSVQDSLDIAAVTLSLGTTGTWSSSCDTSLAWRGAIDAVTQLRSVGVLTVAAAGNSGSKAGMSAPACLSSVVSVSATTMSDEIPSFANIGESVDVLAPGVDIVSSTSGSGYRSWSGTSMAVPHVAGGLALLREAAPSATAEQLQLALRTSRVLVDDARSGGTTKGLPRLDLAHALTTVVEPPAGSDSPGEDDEPEGTGPESPAIDPTVAPSTNDRNRELGWAHFEVTASAGGVTTVEFLQPRPMAACFEYRGSTDALPLNEVVNPNGAVSDGLWPYLCLGVDGSATSMPKEIEGARPQVRLVFGAESDERFPWTDVLPVDSAGATAPDAATGSADRGPSRTEKGGAARPDAPDRTARSGRPSGNSFADVRPDAYYSSGVRWMVSHGITQGTAQDRFSPAADVSRMQMALFLWRAAGSPTGFPDHGFSDVPSETEQGLAVRWMARQGITTGADGHDRFAPDESVTRAQMAALLWRAAGQPSVGTDHGFADVPADAYFDEALRWLRDERITEGREEAGVFAPGGPVSRAQMATFLWRAAGRP